MTSTPVVSSGASASPDDSEHAQLTEPFGGYAPPVPTYYGPTAPPVYAPTPFPQLPKPPSVGWMWVMVAFSWTLLPAFVNLGIGWLKIRTARRIGVTPRRYVVPMVLSVIVLIATVVLGSLIPDSSVGSNPASSSRGTDIGPANTVGAVPVQNAPATQNTAGQLPYILPLAGSDFQTVMATVATQRKNAFCTGGDTGRTIIEAIWEHNPQPIGFSLPAVKQPYATYQSDLAAIGNAQQSAALCTALQDVGFYKLYKEASPTQWAVSTTADSTTRAYVAVFDLVNGSWLINSFH